MGDYSGSMSIGKGRMSVETDEVRYMRDSSDHDNC